MSLIVSLTNEQLDAYLQVFKDALPRILQIRISWRTARVGALLPAGTIIESLAETHSYTQDDDGQSRFYLYVPDEQDPDDSQHVSVTGFPDPHIDYVGIIVMPPRSQFTSVKRHALIQGVPIGAPPAAAATSERKRERDAVAEDVGDAMRGEGQKQTGEGQKRRVCAGLKIPLEIPERHELFYPPLFADRILANESVNSVTTDWKK